MKSDQLTIRKRVEEILSLRLLGAEFVDIRQHAKQQKWRVSDRQLWRYIAQSDEALAETLEKDRGKQINRHIAQRRALYARAMSVSDYGTARAVLKDEAELLQLYDPPRGGGDNKPAAGPLKDSADVARVLADQLGRIAAAEITEGERSRLTVTLADSFLRALALGAIEARLAALEGPDKQRG